MGNKHKAVDGLCDILNRFPSEQKYNLVFFACFSVGLSRDPTGLEPTEKRKLEHLHWDFTLDDLRKRLVQLVDEHDLLEQMVVEGVLAFLISFYRKLADPNDKPRIVQNHLDLIEGLKEQLRLPISQRKSNVSDEHLRHCIARLEKMLAGIETRWEDAEQTLHFLQQEAKDTFTDEFWE